MSGNVIFSTREINEACLAAKAAGGPRPLSRVFSIDTKARSVSYGHYLRIKCTAAGKSGPLVIRFLNEIHSGQIAPSDEDEVTRMNITRPDDNKLTRRDPNWNPSLCIRKYKKDPKSEETSGCGDLNDPENISECYATFSYIEEFFLEEMNQRINNNSIVPKSQQGRFDPKTTLLCGSLNIIMLRQLFLSDKNKSSPRGEISNPMIRLTIRFNNDRPETNTQFYDGLRPFRNKDTGLRDHPEILVHGRPICEKTVHYIKPRSSISGIVNMKDVCLSNFGISIPTRLTAVIISPPVQKKVAASDIFNMEADIDDPDEPSVTTENFANDDCADESP